MLKRLTNLVLLLTVLVQANQACYAADTLTKTQTLTQPGVAGKLTGSDRNANAMLYNANCAICHGQSKRGEPSSRIGNAIKKNTGGMGSLKFLTEEQIRSITDF